MGTNIRGTAAPARWACNLACACTLAFGFALVAGQPAWAEPTTSPTTSPTTVASTPTSTSTPTPAPTPTPSTSSTPSTGCPADSASITYVASGKTCIGTEIVSAAYVDDRPGYACPEGFLPAGAVKPNAVCRASGEPNITDHPVRVDLYECPPGFTSADSPLTEASDCTRIAVVPLQLPGKGTAEQVPAAVAAGGGGSDHGPVPWPALGLLVLGIAIALSMSVRLTTIRFFAKG